MEETFLHFVARSYANDSDIDEYCFVFPNRRAGKYFAKELSECVGEMSHAVLSPEITTISNFVADITESVEANRIELLIMLYEAYKQAMPDNSVTFDRFVHWGDVILNDFGDVDRYMVDARDLFVNISDYKEIKTNGMTPELKEIVGRYFNLRENQMGGEDFWQHIKREDGEIAIRKNFNNIWSQLNKIYTNFLLLLEKNGLTYGGKMYRDAVERVTNMKIEDFEYKKYVFVGFNVLSKSEQQLFERMREKKVADFLWDYNSPAFDTARNKGTKFLSNYVKEFKSPFEMQKNESFPKHMYSIGVPSNFGQAQYAAEIIKQLVAKGALDKQNAIDTAIVLPDEALFMPLVKAIDAQTMPNINVTMGLSIRHSSIATLMRMLTKMHYQAKKVGDEWTYFHADVKDVLLHPVVKFMYQEEALALIDDINLHNEYQVNASKITNMAPNLAPLFAVVKEFTVSEVEKYVDGVLSFTDAVLRKQQCLEKTLEKEGEDADADGQVVSTIELAFLSSYRDALQQLKKLLSQGQMIKADDKFDISTFCYLLDRLVGSTKVAIEGEPLCGLQIMGLLETRCLDFKNVVILSMNERIFPRKHFSKSFIPQNFRRAFEMSTVEHQESMYAYYFYRLISRAENVFMLYDSRTQGASSGEESRFIRQLKTIYADKCKVECIMPGLGIQAPAKYPISVKKDDRVMGILEKYRKSLPEDASAVDEMVRKGELKLLSAHSINAYIDCPLRFYLRYVEGLAEIEEQSEFMEASTFGTIFHDTIQQMFDDGRIETLAYIDNLLDKSNKIIDDTIIVNINKYFLKKGDKCHEALYGESKLKSDIVRIFVERVLRHDRALIEKYGDIEYIEGEKKHICQLQIGLNKVNFSYTIDRLDRFVNAPNELRIVDYKTGRDKTGFMAVKDLFDASRKERNHAILQLLLYCKALLGEKKYSECVVKPIIYSLVNIDDSRVGYKKNSDKNQFEYQNTEGKYDSDISEFNECLEQKINEMFDKDQPFVQTENENNCKYCKFKDFCRK